MRSDQLDKRRRGHLLLRARNCFEALLQTHIVQPQRMSDRMQTVLPRQFYCGLPKRLRQLRPMRLHAAKLIKPSLQLRDWLGDTGCAFIVQYQPTSAADRT
jgi:hypothetical protein